ncbi:MAG: hypothetical protein ACI9N1_001626 [Flavobacteriales bacterium]|jgi:hypothetical protein
MTAISQSDTRSNSIDIYFNPVNVRLGNINNQRIIIDHDRIDINYSKFITQDLGLTFNHKLKRNPVYIQAGVNFSQIKYGYTLSIDAGSKFNPDGDYFISRETRDIGLFGLQLGFSLPIVKSTSVTFSVEMNFIAQNRSNTEPLSVNKNYSLTRYSSGQVIADTELNISENINNLTDGSDYYIPGINFQTSITKNISLNYGLKYKFWGKENFIDIQVKGYYDTPSDPETILFKSTVNNSQMITYFGFAYTFGLGKNKKQE